MHSDVVKTLHTICNRVERAEPAPPRLASAFDPLRTFTWGGTFRVMTDDNEPSAEDQWQDQSMTAVYQFGLALKALHQTNPWPDVPLLRRVMNHLMTELWDHGFSQTEIREAFEEAVADMPRYAAGEEFRR